MTGAVIEVLKDRENWKRLAADGLLGIQRHYSWQAHAERYLAELRPLLEHRAPEPAKPETRRRPMLYHDRAICTDLDQNLFGDFASLAEFVRVGREILDAIPGLARQPKSDQGRFKVSYFIDSMVVPPLAARVPVEEAIADFELPVPDYMIGDVGASVYAIRDGVWRPGWHLYAECMLTWLAPTVYGNRSATWNGPRPPVI